MIDIPLNPAQRARDINPYQTRFAAVLNLFYILLSASIGFRRLALRAGAQPKMMPTAAEKPTPSPMAKVFRLNVISVFMQMASDTPKPTIDADDAAKQREDDCLDQKLHLNLPRFGAKRLAQADFRRALS